MKKYIAIAAAILVFVAVAAFGAGDFNKPSGSSLRPSFMAELRDMFADQAKLFAGTSTTNYPTGAIRLNASTHTLERYNGSTWDVLDLTGLNVGSVVSKVPAAASGLATLDSSSKVVQDPASASTTPGANSIPKLTAGSVLALPNAVHTINSVKIATMTSGQSDGTNIIHTKAIPIGDWNMDSTASVNIAHGLADYTKIVWFAAMIRLDDDAGIGAYPIDYFIGSTTAGTLYLGSTGAYYTLARTAGALFDGVNFDKTSFNRGYLVILYIE